MDDDDSAVPPNPSVLHEPGRLTTPMLQGPTDDPSTRPNPSSHLNTPQNQAFGVFVMFEMDLFQRGGYNADNMGLGKVLNMNPQMLS